MLRDIFRIQFLMQELDFDKILIFLQQFEMANTGRIIAMCSHIYFRGLLMLCCDNVSHQVNISLCAISQEEEVSESTSLQLLWSQYQSFIFLDFQIGFGFGFLGYKNSGFGSVACGKTMIFLIWKPVIEKSHISDTVLFAILNCMRSDEKSQFI